jgi:hypothetical protein
MKIVQRVTLLITSAVLLFASVSPAGAAPSHAAMNRLTIAITTTSGSVWGKVTARYTWSHKNALKSCSQTKCTFQIPHGAMLHVKQTATNTATWPFKDWVVKTSRGTATKMGSSVSMKMNANATVTAVYILKQTQSSNSSSGSGSGGYYYPPISGHPSG